MVGFIARRTEGTTVPVAVIAARNDVYLVVAGDTIAGHFAVLSVEPALVRLRDTENDIVFQLAMNPAR